MKAQPIEQQTSAIGTAIHRLMAASLGPRDMP